MRAVLLVVVVLLSGCKVDETKPYCVKISSYSPPDWLIARIGLEASRNSYIERCQSGCEYATLGNNTYTSCQTNR